MQERIIKVIPKTIIKDSDIISTSDIDNETIIFKDGKLTAQAEASMSAATSTSIGAGRIATPIEVFNKQSFSDTESPAFVSVDDLKVLFGADFDEASYKCIVSSNSTEIGEYIVKDSNLPDIGISGKSRYVLQNPFGNNTPVITELEVYYNGKWGSTGMYYYSADLIGAKSNYFEGTGIVVQTGSTTNQVMGNSPATGNPFNITTGPTGVLRARVHVYKVGSKNTAKEYADFKIIYSSEDTTDRGAESVKSSKLPANIIINTRYVLDNPFGHNVSGQCVVELWEPTKNEWYAPGNYSQATNQGYHVTAHLKDNEGLVLQTGSMALSTRPNLTGGSASTPFMPNILSAAVRIKCYKTGYNGNLATQSKPGIVRMATSEELKNRKSSDSNIGCVVSPESLAQITTIGNQGSAGYKCIYSKDYTGELGVNDIKDIALPLEIVANSRYVLTNPFGSNTPVNVLIEIYYNNTWGNPEWAVSTNDRNIGARANPVSAKGIIIQSGNFPNYILSTSHRNGNPFGIYGDSAVPGGKPCRVHVWKVGESDIPVFSGPLPETYIFDYLYSTEYESIMKWNHILGFYHSISDISTIELNMNDVTEISKGKYLCDGSLLSVTSNAGKRLLSLSDKMKTKFNIIEKDDFVNLPNMFYTDGCGYYPKFGKEPGNILMDLSTSVPTEGENRRLSMTFLPLINLGV